MTKVRLLNDGDHARFGGFDSVRFPVVVEATPTDRGFDVPLSELKRIGCDTPIDSLYWILGSECELITDTPTTSNPQTTDLAIHCNGIEEVSHSRTSGFKQMVTLTDACVEDVIENIGADRFFAAFDNEELAEHLRKYGYEVTKNDTM